MDRREEFELVLNRIRSERRRLNNEFNCLPKGSLMISTNGPNRISFFQRRKINGKMVSKGIGSNSELIAKLARKAFLLEYRKRLDRYEKEFRSLESALDDLSTEKIRRSLPGHFELIPDDWLLGRTDTSAALHPVFDGSIAASRAELSFQGCSASAWMTEPYCANSSYTEDMVHKAAGGFWCRSKSEAAIAAVYDDLGIPYHYDELIAMRMKYLSPDFRGIRRDGRFIYHEHWGMKSDEYIRKNLSKLQDYYCEGIVPGENLLITFDDEGGGLDLPLIREQIRSIYSLR